MESKDRMALRAWPFRHFCSAVAAVAIAWVLGNAAPVQAQGDADIGERIFTQNNCFVCHGQQGFGGVGPAFRNDPFLTLNDYVVGQILMGRGVMPPFRDQLDDRQVAAVATYIRNSWGNHFGIIKPELVTQIRRELDALRQQAVESPPPSTGSVPQPGPR